MEADRSQNERILGQKHGGTIADAPFSVYMALDGPHLDGLIGSAGVVRFDWPEREFHIEHFAGISAAHNVSLSPNGYMALLGNFSQQLVLLDITKKKAQIAKRQSTMFIEECTYRLRANTHHLWYDDNRHFIGAVGDHLYKFDTEDLKSPKNLGPHGLYNAHELRWDKSRRYVLIGDLGPENRAAQQVAVFDLQEPDEKKRSRVIRVPTNNVWHCCVHPEKQVGYALTYCFAIDNEDYVDWSPAYTREYIMEIDLPTTRITRSWSCGSEFPVHLNSDVGVSADEKLYIASGGCHSIVEIPLETFDSARVIPCVPNWWIRLLAWRQKGRNVLGALSRKPTAVATHYILQTLQVTNWRVMDGVYAARVSPDGKYLVAGHRGYNMVTVYDRATMKKVYSKQLPFRRDRPGISPHIELGNSGYHLGIHHSEVIAR
jgi:hypothetical protein